MRITRQTETLTVADYITLPVMNLISHPDYNQEMMDRVISLSQMGAYEILGDHVAILDGFGWDFRSKIHEMIREEKRRINDLK